MNILFAASEAVPFCKTGGMADVVTALLKSLKTKRQDVRLILPKYRGIDVEKYNIRPLDLRVVVPVGNKMKSAAIWAGDLDSRIKVYFLEAPEYFDREGLYVDDTGKDFSDNNERFVFYSKALLETCKVVHFRPDVIHCHDWQTGLIPVYLKTIYRWDSFFTPTAVLMTIHNIAYQGIFPKETLTLAGLSWDIFTKENLEYFDKINYLKGGLVFSQLINTVSPAYAREVQEDEEKGCGLEGVLSSRSKDFYGILNGLDQKEWNPAADSFVKRKFSFGNMTGRNENKSDLQKYSGLSVDEAAPVLGMVSRLDPQKGFDMVLEIMDDLLKEGVQFAILGQGDRILSQELQLRSKRHPGVVSYCSDFNEPLAHKIYGGADMFLMPSRFEPCGLSQMISLRYGAVPIVAPTGGLLDTVKPFQENAPNGIGFMMKKIEAADLYKTILQALSIYRNQNGDWKNLMKRGMKESFSWKNSVKKYMELYKKAMVQKKENVKN